MHSPYDRQLSIWFSHMFCHPKKGQSSTHFLLLYICESTQLTICENNATPWICLNFERRIVQNVDNADFDSTRHLSSNKGTYLTALILIYHLTSSLLRMLKAALESWRFIWRYLGCLNLNGATFVSLTAFEGGYFGDFLLLVFIHDPDSRWRFFCWHSFTGGRFTNEDETILKFITSTII